MIRIILFIFILLNCYGGETMPDYKRIIQRTTTSERIEGKKAQMEPNELCITEDTDSLIFKNKNGEFVDVSKDRNTINSINELITSKKFKINDIITLNLPKPHKRKIESTAKINSIQLNNGLFANIIEDSFGVNETDIKDINLNLAENNEKIINLEKDLNKVSYGSVPGNRIEDNSISSSKFKFSTNQDKIKPEHLSDEVKEMMSGQTPLGPIIENKSITEDKIANKAISKKLLSDDIKATLEHNELKTDNTNLLGKNGNSFIENGVNTIVTKNNNLLESFNIKNSNWNPASEKAYPAFRITNLPGGTYPLMAFKLNLSNIVNVSTIKINIYSYKNGVRGKLHLINLNNFTDNNYTFEFSDIEVESGADRVDIYLDTYTFYGENFSYDINCYDTYFGYSINQTDNSLLKEYINKNIEKKSDIIIENTLDLINKENLLRADSGSWRASKTVVESPLGFNGKSKTYLFKLDTTNWGYTWNTSYSPSSFPSKKITVSARFMKKNKLSENINPLILIYFYDENSKVISYIQSSTLNANMQNTLGTRLGLTTDIPGNTARIAIGWGAADTTNEPTEYYIGDEFIADGDVPINFYSNSNINSNQSAMLIKTIAKPRTIYTVANNLGDTIQNPSTSANIYLDSVLSFDKKSNLPHIKNGIKPDLYSVYPKITIDSKGNVVYNEGSTIKEYNENFTITDDLIDTQITYKHRSTLASVGADKHPRVLIIGDSITAGAGLSFGNYPNKPYSQHIAEFFAKDKLMTDNLNKYNITMLGTVNYRNFEINHNNKTKNVSSINEGRGGWSLYDYLRMTTIRRPSQETWDALGLGNGTGKDFINTQENRTLISRTCEVNTAQYPGNPFFDNSKLGTNKFSISKWLERYRTIDDVTGVKMELGNPNLGTYITTQDRLDKINVAIPTHVIIQLGTNDLSFIQTDEHLKNLRELITELKSQIPGVFIAISPNPKRAGTLLEEYYPNLKNIETSSNTVTSLLDVFNSHKEEFLETEEANRLYLLSTVSITPTAYSFNLKPYNDAIDTPDFKTNIYTSFYDNVHLSYQAHICWSYQMYSWIKYTLNF